MSRSCRDDPVVCIDAVAIFIAEFLKDWTTLAMLAILLVLLLKLKYDREKAAHRAYSEQMMVYEERRREKG